MKKSLAMPRCKMSDQLTGCAVPIKFAANMSGLVHDIIGTSYLCRTSRAAHRHVQSVG
jgi:hypothetical protein